jgi:hypothetical protein
MSTLTWSDDLRSTFQLFKNEKSELLESLSKLNTKEKQILMNATSDQSLNNKSSNATATIQGAWM